MDNYGSFKDFESVRLKATSTMEIGNRTFQPGETLAYFDKIQIAGLDENRQWVTAHGGYGDRDHVFWETTKNVRLQFSQGVFSKDQLALLVNAHVADFDAPHGVAVSEREYLESDENGNFTTKYEPYRNIYVYNKQTGEKVEYELNGAQFTIQTPYMDVIVDYEFAYYSKVQRIEIGHKLFNGFVELEGRTRYKDDTTGEVVTGIIVVPRLKLMSGLSIRLGAQASPIVASFEGLCEPVGPREQAYVSDFYFLSDDLDGDL